MLPITYVAILDAVPIARLTPRSAVDKLHDMLYKLVGEAASPRPGDEFVSRGGGQENCEVH